MTFTLGRADLGIVSSLNLSGDQLSVSGRLGTGLSLVQAQRLRQQLSGLVSDGRGLVVPVVYTHDSTVDGFYRVDDVTVDTGPGGKALTFWPWSARLTRVSGYAAPLFESVLVSTVRDNAHGYVAPGETGTDVRPWFGIPPDWFDLGAGIEGGAVTGGVRVSSGGDVRVIVDPGMMGESVRQWGVSPAGWYGGSAEIRVGGAPLVGRQTVNSPSTVKLDNGIVRVDVNTVYGFWLGVFGWSGTDWADVTFWEIRDNEGEENKPRRLAIPSSVSVLWNRPEVVAVRLSGRVVRDETLLGTVPEGRYDLDLAVRRGSRTVDGVVQLSPSSTTRWGVFRAADDAAATLDGAIRRNVSAQRAWLAVCPDPSSAINTGSGTPAGLLLDSAPTGTLRFAVGTCDTTASPAPIDAPQEVVRQYMASVAENVTVSAR